MIVGYASSETWQIKQAFLTGSIILQVIMGCNRIPSSKCNRTPVFFSKQSLSCTLSCITILLCASRCLNIKACLSP